MKCVTIIIFLFGSLFLSPFAYKFVILDPDDPNLVKNANQSIKDPKAREKSIKLAKFRKWLKYDVDCNFISRPELESRILHGRCPYPTEEEITTTTTKKPRFSFFKTKKRKPIVKKTEKGLFSHDSKEKVVRMVVGSNKMKEIDLTPVSDDEIEIVNGQMITLKCDETARKLNKSEEFEVVDWYVNSEKVRTSWFDWRVSISQDGRFGIWPIEEGDGGHFECFVDNQLRASVSLKVVSMSEKLLAGFTNYLYVCAIFGIPIALIAGFLGFRKTDETTVEVDRMEEFLAEHVFKTDEMAKKRVADIMDRQKVVDDREMIENRSANNRSTIRLLLQNPNLVQSHKELKASESKTNQEKGETKTSKTSASTTSHINPTKKS